MHPHEYEKLALTLMDKHGLIDKGWKFKWSNGKRIFGSCNDFQKVITLSQYLTPLRKIDKVKNTILHEIAHALVGVKEGHNHVWINKAIEIGCDGHAKNAEDNYFPKVYRYKATCSCMTHYMDKPRAAYQYTCKTCKTILNFELNK